MEKHNVFFLSFLLVCFWFGGNVAYTQSENNNGEWLYMDRALPYDSIPPDAFKNAVDLQSDMRESEGYSLSPEVASWLDIGPSNYDRNGRVVRVKYDFDDPSGNTVYLCGHNAGVWKSTNAQSPPSQVVFTSITPDLLTQSSGDIAIDRTNDILYYGTGGNVFGIVFNFYGIGVYKSTNAGTDWTGPYTAGLPSAIFTSAIAVNPTNGDVYLANGAGIGAYGGGDGAGLYKSTNGGVNWNKVLPTSGSNPCYDVCFDGNDLYVAMFGGFWKSTNGGANFTQLPVPTQNYVSRTQISVSKENGITYVYILLRHCNVLPDCDIVTMYTSISTDGGSNFSSLRYLADGYGAMSLDFMFIQASPWDQDVAVAGYGTAESIGLWRTVNAGANYESITPIGADQNNFAFSPYDEQQGILCNDFGVWRTDNLLTEVPGQVSFEGINKTLSLIANYRVASNPSDAQDMVIAVSDAGFFKYSGGVNWVETNFGCDGTSVIHTRGQQPQYPDAFIGSKGVEDYRCNSNSNLYASNDGGANWPYHPSVSSWGLWDGNLDWIAAFAEKPDAFGTFYHPRRNKTNNSLIDINVSTNYGANWSQNQPGSISQISTGNGSFSPQWISFCDANPLVIYVSTKRWLTTDPLSQVWRTMDGGLTAWQNLDITNNGVPNRVVTSVVTDPIHDNVVYLTLSGFGTGHVYKSYNSGVNWVDISSGPPHSSTALPDIPVNYMVIRSIQGPGKELIVGTDAGVYSCFDNEGSPAPLYKWKEVAVGLPNTVCLGLDYNNWSKKLRAALFGRGIWQVTLDGPIYIAGNQTIGSTQAGLNVADDIVIDSGSTLTIPQSCTIKMPPDKKIIVEDGGKIDVTSNDPVYFTSQSGSWGGIEIQEGGYGTIKNCVFENTETPITINSQRNGGDTIVIQNCTFKNGSVLVNGRDNVTISKCTTSTASATTGIGITANYCDNLVLSQNEISGCWASGIMVSNSSPVILYNVIGHAEQSNTAAGISLDNCYSGTVNHNQVTNFNCGIYLYYSSPSLLHNTVINSTTSYVLDPYSLHANYLSSPRLKPTDDGQGGIIWDAGINTLKTNYQGTGIYLYDMSFPNIDYGYNNIYGYDYELGGWIGDETDFYAQNNCWSPVEPPINENIMDATVIDDPFTCEPPGGGGESTDDPIVAEKAVLSKADAPPPPPIIINYGNGIVDTIRVSSGNVPMNADQLLFSQGLDAELDGNYLQAISKYTQLVQNYQDSASAINALKKILYCNDRLHSNSNTYSTLRSYYQNLASQNPTDTGFVRAAKEMASKCLVRINECPAAITEYEAVVQNSNDSLEVLCAELNIIETYMIMEQGGDAPGFTGQIKELKPSSVLDGIKMINEKLHRMKPTAANKQVPLVFRLSQNYPNPFNPLTKIDFAIPKKSNVTLKVYDILGRLVTTLVNDFREAGIYTVQFDGTNLSSGVYFYTIEAGEYKASKKMVLVK